MKNIILAFALIAFAVPTQAQLLKKIKDKVNKTIDKAAGTEDASSDDSSSSSSSSATSSSSSSSRNNEEKSCTAVEGVDYTTVYSSSGKMDIIYNESSLGLGNDNKGYRLILSERVDGKTRFVVVENGKVVDTDTKVKNQYVSSSTFEGSSVGDPGEARNEEMKKYIIADSTTHTIPKTAAKSATVQKMDDNQFETALAVAKQTDEYKNMSAEEKKELEEAMKKAVAYNNSMAGQTISVPGQQGGSFSSITGYKVVVKGKTYGKFMMPPVLEVSNDGANVFAVGIDENSKPVMLSNGKKTMLDKSKYTAVSGKILRSPDLKKSVYVEQKQMSNDEIQSIYSSNGTAKMSYNILKADGSSMLVTDYNNSGKFLLTNSGAVINVNESTAEVYADNKKVGKFKVRDGYSFEANALLVGSDVAKIAYYDGAEGSINYLDGTVLKLGALYPTVVSESGKNYLNWFRKCKNEIYLAKVEF